MGVGLGAGVGMGQAMAGMIGNINAPQAAVDDPVTKLTKLKQMLDNNLINQQEYDTKKQQILAQM